MINIILSLIHGKWDLFIWANSQGSMWGFRKQVVKARRNLTLPGNSFFHVRTLFQGFEEAVFLGSKLARNISEQVGMW